MDTTNRIELDRDVRVELFFQLNLHTQLPQGFRSLIKSISVPATLFIHKRSYPYWRQEASGPTWGVNQTQLNGRISKEFDTEMTCGFHNLGLCHVSKAVCTELDLAKWEDI